MRIKSIVFSMLFAASVSVLLAETFKPERYDKVDARELETSPEKYKGKRIFIQTTFTRLLPTFPNYFEKNGIKPEKYYCMIIYPWNVAVILRKKSDMGEIVSDMKPLSEIKVYGKVKKFTRSSKLKRLPKYYFEPDYIEVVKSGNENIKAREEVLRKKLENIRRRKKRQANYD